MVSKKKSVKSPVSNRTKEVVDVHSIKESISKTRPVVNIASKTSEVLIKKTAKGKTTPDSVNKRKKKKVETLNSYIYKVLKQVHNDTGISKKSMEIMNSFLMDLYERVALEASKLVRYNKKQTLSAREIQSAVKLVIPGELAKHALIEGSKAVNKFATSNTGN